MRDFFYFDFGAEDGEFFSLEKGMLDPSGQSDKKLLVCRSRYIFFVIYLLRLLA